MTEADKAAFRTYWQSIHGPTGSNDYEAHRACVVWQAAIAAERQTTADLMTRCCTAILQDRAIHPDIPKRDALIAELKALIQRNPDADDA